MPSPPPPHTHQGHHSKNHSRIHLLLQLSWYHLLNTMPIANSCTNSIRTQSHIEAIQFLVILHTKVLASDKNNTLSMLRIANKPEESHTIRIISCLLCLTRGRGRIAPRRNVDTTQTVNYM